MSSNIRIERICQLCMRIFIAKTTVTKYCSDNCSKRAYKARLKNKKIEVSVKETRSIKNKLQSTIRSKEYLTVSDASELLNCSTRTLYRFINEGKVKASNLSIRKTLIRKCEIDSFFDQQIIEPVIINESESEEFKIELYYNIGEIQQEFNISEKALYELIKRNNISKCKRGKFVYVKKILINKLLAKWQK